MYNKPTYNYVGKSTYSLAAQAEIVTESGSRAVDLHMADVSSQESIRRFAAAFLGALPAP
jgi:hypothetical protein